jgi:hypothetical protein
MEEQRVQVLDMLEAGTITAQQANELLVALGDELAQAAPAQRGPGERSNRSAREEGRRGREDARWIRKTHDRHERSERPERREAVRMLAEAAAHGVDPNYIRELREAGITDLSLKELIELSIHGVSAQYIRDMRDAGYDHLSARELTELSIHGVTPEFAREMQNVGFAELNPREVEDEPASRRVDFAGVHAPDAEPPSPPAPEAHFTTPEGSDFDDQR